MTIVRKFDEVVGEVPWWTASKTCYRAAFGYDNVVRMRERLKQLFGGAPHEFADQINIRSDGFDSHSVWEKWPDGFETLAHTQRTGPSDLYVKHASPKQLKLFKTELRKLLG